MCIVRLGVGLDVDFQLLCVEKCKDILCLQFVLANYSDNSDSDNSNKVSYKE